MSYVRVLEDNKTDFQYLLVGKNQLPKLRWGLIRVICIAEGFEQADIDYISSCRYAVELVSYRYFNNDTLLLEWVHGQPPDSPLPLPAPRSAPPKPKPSHPRRSEPKPVPSTFGPLVKEFHRTVQSIGPGITHYRTDVYEGYKKNGKIFVTFKVLIKARRIRVWLPLDPLKEKTDGKILKDMTNVGHLGLGDFEIVIESKEILGRYAHLIRKSYDTR